MEKQIALFFGLITLCVTQAAVYKKFIVNDRDALCLDGSPGVYYLSEGTSKTKFIIFFDGGAWCGDYDLPSTLESCYQRSFTDLGSSKNYPNNMVFPEGILSLKPQNSFRDFTKAYFKYCDGSGHQGTKSEPIQYKDTKLYFRGSNLTIARLNQLERLHGLFTKSTQILVTGISAGGLAAFQWADYIRDKSAHKNVYAAPDSGIFLDSTGFQSKQHQYRNMFVNLFKLSNVQIDPPVPDCVKKFPKETYMCMFVQNFHPYIKTPIFSIQSLYDSWSLGRIISLRCLRGRSLNACNTQKLAYIQQYRKNTSKILHNIAANPENGYWAIACADHVYFWNKFYSPDYEIPMNSNNTVDKTLFSWYQKKPENHRYMDNVSWPENKPCSGFARPNRYI